MIRYKIPTSYYREQLPVLENSTNRAIDKQLSLWQHILVVSSGIDGVLISLHCESPSHLYIRVVFFSLSGSTVSRGIMQCHCSI